MHGVGGEVREPSVSALRNDLHRILTRLCIAASGTGSQRAEETIGMLNDESPRSRGEFAEHRRKSLETGRLCAIQQQLDDLGLAFGRSDGKRSCGSRKRIISSP